MLQRMIDLLLKPSMSSPNGVHGGATQSAEPALSIHAAPTQAPPPFPNIAHCSPVSALPP